jgi:hypothetical protein
MSDEIPDVWIDTLTQYLQWNCKISPGKWNQLILQKFYYITVNYYQLQENRYRSNNFYVIRFMFRVKSISTIKYLCEPNFKIYNNKVGFVTTTQPATLPLV